MKSRKSKTNPRYFQDIPKPLSKETYEEHKSFMDKLKKEKVKLNDIALQKKKKNAEYVKAQQIERQLGIEYRELGRMEEEQRDKIIALIEV